MTEEELSSPEPQGDTNMAMLCHLLALAGFAVPFGNILGPLIMWLVKRDEDPLVDAAGKQALNFNITVTIAGVVSAFLMVILIGYALFAVLSIYWLILVILASVKASSGETYSYPLTIQFLK